MSSRSHKEEQNQAYVNGMEVSGIDPQIVREEQQPKMKAPMPQQYAMHTNAGGYDQVAFQNYLTQQSLQALGTQVGTPGKMQQQLPRQHQHEARPQIPQAPQQQPPPQQAPLQQPQQPPQSQQPQQPQQQYQQFPQMYLQNQAAPPTRSQQQQQQPAAGRQQASPSSSTVKPTGASRDLMQLTSEARLATPPTSARVGKRRVRLGWTEEETQHLMEGCKRHGVGNWKKILTDPHFDFNCRTAVDLKDRFRTSFPEEYSRLYPNARTHKVKRLGAGNDASALVKINRKERRSFNAEEDDRLLQGFLKHGPAWSKIQRDPVLNLGERRSTDLRDRFRNAFPERYTAAGYKGRSGNGKSLALPGPEISVQSSQMQQMPPINMLEEDTLQSHNMVPRTYMPQHPIQLQTMQGMNGYQYFSS